MGDAANDDSVEGLIVQLKAHADAISRLADGMAEHPAALSGLARVTRYHAEQVARICARIRKGQP